MTATATRRTRTRNARRTVVRDSRRAVGYVRISALMGRTQGDDLLSDVIQRERIEAWAKATGYSIVEWYADLDVSGRAGVRRAEFDRMMADARHGRFDAVVVYRLDRFGRSLADNATSARQLQDAGEDLVSCSEQLDTSNANGKLMLSFLFALAEFYSDRISEEWRAVHANRRARGIAQVNTMFGYKTKGTVIVGVNEPEAEALRRAFERRAKGGSTRQVAQRLHDAGFRSKRSGTRTSAAT